MIYLSTARVHLCARTRRSVVRIFGKNVKAGFGLKVGRILLGRTTKISESALVEDSRYCNAYEVRYLLKHVSKKKFVSQRASAFSFKFLSVICLIMRRHAYSILRNRIRAHLQHIRT